MKCPVCENNIGSIISEDRTFFKEGKKVAEKLFLDLKEHNENKSEQFPAIDTVAMLRES